MTEHEERDSDLERGADELEERGDRLDREVGEVRDDWDAKKGDASVPGAQPSEGERGDERETSAAEGRKETEPGEAE